MTVIVLRLDGELVQEPASFYKIKAKIAQESHEGRITKLLHPTSVYVLYMNAKQ